MNLGDSMIFVTAIVFGRKYGLAAGGLGSALADILGGYATWAPWTLVIKGIEGNLAGMLYDTARSETRSRTESEAPSADESKIRTETKSNNRPRIAHILTATSIAGAWMVAGYFIAGTISRVLSNTSCRSTCPAGGSSYCDSACSGVRRFRHFFPVTFPEQPQTRRTPEEGL